MSRRNSVNALPALSSPRRERRNRAGDLFGKSIAAPVNSKMLFQHTKVTGGCNGKPFKVSAILRH
jgi:hypothetical protein